MSQAAKLVVFYIAFAVVATLANLASQRLALAAYGGPYGIVLAMAVGTGAGLVTKYLLDKRWIFADRSTGVSAHGRTFGLYTMTGIGTTLIFWGSEGAFWAIYRTETMRELGAVLGLAIGYVIKYQLDKRFVFNRSSR